MAIFFNGKRLVKPQASSKIDVSNLSSVGAGALREVCVIGQATGGQPGVVHTFTGDPAAANALFRGGDLLQALNLIWNPSPNNNGAVTIKAIRVNAATQASNNSNSSELGLTVTSKDYGIWNNSIQFKIEAASAKKVTAESNTFAGIRIDSVSDGASSGSLAYTHASTTLVWKSGTAVDISAGGNFTCYASGSTTDYINVYVTAASLTTNATPNSVTIGAQGVKWTNQYTPTNTLEIQDNLGSAFTIRYVGAGTTATVTITVTNGVAVTFATATPGDEAGNLSLSLTDGRFDTISELVNYLNGTGVFYAEISPYLRNQAMNTSNLNSCSADLRTAAGKDTPLTITANAGALIDWSSNESQFISITKKTDTAETASISLVGWSALASGSEGSSTTTQWAAALALLENEDIDIIVPLTTDTAIQALVATHVESMSNNKKERRAYYGAPLGYTKQQLKALATATNSRRAMLVTPGIKIRNYDGTVATYNSTLAAAAVAGMMAGFTSIAEPVTYKLLNIVGLERDFNSSEIDELLDAGVAVIEYAKNLGWRVTQGRTTYTKDANVVNVEDSVSSVADYISKDLRTALENEFVGQRATATSVSNIKSFIISKLKSYELAGIITGGVDPDTGATVAAYRNVNVSFSNRTCTATYEVSPVEPINYITLTAVLKPATIIV